MKRIIVVVISLLLVSAPSLAFSIHPLVAGVSQSPPTEWSRTYGGPNADQAMSVIQTSDGGYALAGFTKSFGKGGWDFWLVKTDSSGTTQWNRTYGGTADDLAYSVIQTSDGGYAVVGNTIIGGYGNAWLVKTDSSGNMQWNKSYTEIGWATAYALIQTNDGGCVMAGCKEYYDGWLMKTDANGTMQWSRSFVEVNNTQLESVVQTNDGGYIATGATQWPPFTGKVNAYVVKTDADGNTTWSKEFSRTVGNDYGRSIVQTGDGGYAIAGETDHWGNADFWLIKTDASGNFLWDRTYGGAGWDGANSIVQTSDGGYALAGQTNSFGAGGNDLWVVKTDAEGNMQWNETYGGAGDEGTGDAGSSVVQTRDGGYALTGYTNSFGAGSSDFYLVKLASSGRPPKTWIVDANGSGDFLTIQAAINAASDGDTIFVRNGTYYENVVVNKTLNLRGENRNSTIVDGNNTGNVVTLVSNNADVSGFTFQHSAGALYSCIRLDQVSGCSIFSNIANNSNSSASGNGIFLQSSGRNNISDNLVINTWDGITFRGSCNNTISGNTVVNLFNVGGTSIQFVYGSAFNQAIGNAFLGIAQIGIRCYQGDSGSNVLVGNRVENHHFGIYADGSSNNIFYHNSIVNNTINQAYVPYSVNVWDNGYPSSGNYWSDYTGVDVKSGPYQNETGSDGIGDTPYAIDANNVDHYPLMSQFPPTEESIPPVADFIWSPRTPIASELTTFDASSSKNGWNGTASMPINSFTWDFGDNSTAVGQLVTHTYTSSGNYSVRLNVTDVQGLWNTTEKQIQVGQQLSPEAAFTANPEVVQIGKAVEFNASSSLAGWNGTDTMPIVEYDWSFGDGNTTSTYDFVIAHSFALPGTFNVTLTIFDVNGMNSSCSKWVLVIMPTYVSVSTSSTSTFVGFTVNINGTLHDIYGNGLQNEPVVLYYTFAGVTSWFPMTSSITDSLGHYSAQWIPTATGNFQIKAEWAGNLTYSGTSSNVTLSSVSTMNQYIFSVESNSTISALSLNTTSWELGFTANGSSGTSGYVKVTIAKSLIANIANIKVYLDNTQIDYSIESVDDSWLLTFNYTHSTHEVRVDLSTSVVPEFSTSTILLLLVILAVAVLIPKKRRLAPLSI